MLSASLRMIRLRWRGRTTKRSTSSLVTARFWILHVLPDAAEEAVAAPVVVGEAAPVVDAVEPSDDDDPVMKLAIGGPGKTYGASGVKTFGSKMPGSLSEYAPGMLTRSLADGAPAWLPPTVICAQAG